MPFFVSDWRNGRFAALILVPFTVNKCSYFQISYFTRNPVVETIGTAVIITLLIVNPMDINNSYNRHRMCFPYLNLDP